MANGRWVAANLGGRTAAVRVALLALVALVAAAAPDAQALLARSDGAGLTVRGEVGDDEFVRVQIVEAGTEWDVHNLNSNLYSPSTNCRTVGLPGILVPPVFSSMRCERSDARRLDVDLNSGDDIFQVITVGSQRFDDPLQANGDSGADDISGTRRADEILGGTGNDILRGFLAGDEIRGQGGQDTILGGDGDDTINGGARRDVLEGNAGDDDITGSTARDTINGGDDDDVIRARDDTRDTINCGAGADRAIVDPEDIVRRCDTVERG